MDTSRFFTASLATTPAGAAGYPTTRCAKMAYSRSDLRARTVTANGRNALRSLLCYEAEQASSAKGGRAHAPIFRFSVRGFMTPQKDNVVVAWRDFAFPPLSSHLATGNSHKVGDKSLHIAPPCRKCPALSKDACSSRKVASNVMRPRQWCGPRSSRRPHF